MRVQLYLTIYANVLEGLHELRRNECQERLDLPCGGLNLSVYRQADSYSDFSSQTQIELIDRQTGFIEGKMHRIQIHC